MSTAGTEIEIETVRRLDGPSLSAIAELGRRVVARDGGRLKLELDALRRRDGTGAGDVLAWDRDRRLVGFAGAYEHGPPIAEIAGMVDPAHRRRGIGSALLDAALGACAAHGHRRALLIVPRGGSGGNAGRVLALRRGGRLEHSEHALVLERDPATASAERELALRPATRADLPDVIALLTDGFGSAPTNLGERLHRAGGHTYVASESGRVVATVRVQRDAGAERADVYGFVVDRRLRGRGLGRALLTDLCRDLRGDGATTIGLEVDATNDSALHLYLSIGFAPVAVEDYYELTLSGDGAGGGRPAG